MYRLKLLIFLIVGFTSTISFSQLLPNGDFEIINDKGRLANYVYKDSLYQHIDTTHVYSGRQSAKFNYTKEGIKTLYFLETELLMVRHLNIFL